MTELNATSAALLGLLHDGPATGGELVAAAGEIYGAFFSVTRSQVYRELPALAERGLVRLGKQGPRASQQYIITAAGKKEFKRWATTDPGPDHIRSTMLLRIVNADKLTAKQRDTLIGEARERYNEELTEAKAAVRAADNPADTAIATFWQSHVKAALKFIDTIAAS